jgi:hypothetical protein
VIAEYRNNMKNSSTGLLKKSNDQNTLMGGKFRDLFLSWDGAGWVGFVVVIG